MRGFGRHTTEELDHFSIEGGNIIWHPACDEISVNHDLLVNPFPFGLDRQPELCMAR